MRPRATLVTAAAALALVGAAALAWIALARPARGPIEQPPATAALGREPVPLDALGWPRSAGGAVSLVLVEPGGDDAWIAFGAEACRIDLRTGRARVCRELARPLDPADRQAYGEGALLLARPGAGAVELERLSADAGPPRRASFALPRPGALAGVGWSRDRRELFVRVVGWDAQERHWRLREARVGPDAEVGPFEPLAIALDGMPDELLATAVIAAEGRDPVSLLIRRSHEITEVRGGEIFHLEPPAGASTQPGCLLEATTARHDAACADGPLTWLERAPGAPTPGSPSWSLRPLAPAARVALVASDTGALRPAVQTATAGALTIEIADRPRLELQLPTPDRWIAVPGAHNILILDPNARRLFIVPTPPP